jgi:hypothetical protein
MIALVTAIISQTGSYDFSHSYFVTFVMCVS